MSLAVDARATFVADGTDPFTVDVDLAVEDGETLVVLGPSGSGKSLLLETVAGFHPHVGRVALDGVDVTDDPPEDRGFGFVFQDYALFPHMDVRENVAFGLRYHEECGDPDEVLAELGVAHLADRSPRTLSGGEKQRVALARSLVVRPDALLLDEPLSALDAPTRRALRDDLADAIADTTALYVTHDRTTARGIADRVAVMRDGDVLQVGTPEAVFERPATAFVARFVGANVLPASVLGGADAPGAGTDEQVAVRPEHVALVDPGDAAVAGTVERAVREDAASRVTVAVEGTTLDAFCTDPPATGETVGVAVAPEHVAPLSAADPPPADPPTGTVAETTDD